MADYIIKTGGTATGNDGRYTTPQSGSFASLGVANYYDTSADALAATTPPTNGDRLLFSDSHAESDSATIVLSGADGITGLPLFYITVDDANMDQAAIATSAQIYASAGNDIKLTGINHRYAFYGMWLKSEDDIFLQSPNTFANFYSCTLEVTSSGDVALKTAVNADGCYASLVNCTIELGNATAYAFAVDHGSVLRMFGGSVNIASGTIDAVFQSSSTQGGMTVEVIGVDLSLIDTFLINNTGGLTLDDTMNIRFSRCQLHASLTNYVDETLYGPNKRVEVINSSSSSSAAEYQYYLETDSHTAEDDTAFYRDDSTAFADSAQKASIKAITAASASNLTPFWFDIPARFAELSNASTDTLRIFLLSSDSGLTDQDVWADLIYPDGTNKQTPIYLTTANTDPLATGTALTANSDAWTGRTSETRYQIDLDTSGDVGMDCVPIIRIYVGKPSITVYFDVIVGVVA